MPHSPQSGLQGALGLLAKYDWHQIAAAANASPNHVGNLERWRRKALERNPSLSDEQLERYALLLKKEHYQRMARLSAESRRLARKAAAVADALNGDGGDDEAA